MTSTFTGELGLTDFSALASYWLDSNCIDTPPCGGTDLTGNNAVDINDLKAFASMWLIDYIYPALISHWSFDTDGSDGVSGHDGTLINGASINTTDPAVGVGTLALDGIDDFVQITGYKGITGIASRTCTAWIKPTDASGWNDIIGWGKAETGQRWLLTINPDGLLQLAAMGGYQRSTTTVDNGQWHHVAAVFENDGSPDVSDVRFYIDGVEETAYTTSPLPINTVADKDVAIGIFDDDHSRYFQGLIDDVRVYDEALSRSEIQAVMNE